MGAEGETVETGQAYTTALDEEEEYKYLGVTVRVSWGVFKMAWDNKIKKAEWLANAIYHDSRVFANTTLMGAVGWELVSKPAILYGTEIMTMRATAVNKIQVLQNKLGRKLVHLSERAPMAVEVGDL